MDPLNLEGDFRKCTQCHHTKGLSNFLHKTIRYAPGNLIFTQRCLSCRNGGEEQEGAWGIPNDAGGRLVPRPNDQNKDGPIAGPLPAEVIEAVADDEPDLNNQDADPVPVPAESPDVAHAEEQENLVPEGRGQDDGIAEDAVHPGRDLDITQLFVFDAGALAVAIGGSLLAYWTFDPILPF